MNVNDVKFVINHCINTLTMAYEFSGNAVTTDVKALAFVVMADMEKIADETVGPDGMLEGTAKKVLEIIEHGRTKDRPQPTDAD